MCVEHHIHTKASTVQDSDRWYSHMPCGPEFCQILSQWIWNLRLELGQKLSSSDLRTTEFAKAVGVPPAQGEPVSKHTPAVTYGPAQWACPSFTGGFPGSAFTLQPDGTLRCPADRPLYPQERRASARWLSSGLVCRSHWPLPHLSFAGTMSRKQFQPQTTTGECAVLAARSPGRGFFSPLENAPEPL